MLCTATCAAAVWAPASCQLLGGGVCTLAPWGYVRGDMPYQLSVSVGDVRDDCVYCREWCMTDPGCAAATDTALYYMGSSTILDNATVKCTYTQTCNLSEPVTIATANLDTLYLLDGEVQSLVGCYFVLERGSPATVIRLSACTGTTLSLVVSGQTAAVLPSRGWLPPAQPRDKQPLIVLGVVSTLVSLLLFFIFGMLVHRKTLVSTVPSVGKRK